MLNLQVMTDRFPRIVIQCLDGKNALHSDQYHKIYPASLKGITSKPALFQMEPNYSHVAVSFFSHGVKAFFGIDGYETMDAVLDLHHFFPDDVIEQIMDASNTHTRILLLEKHFLKQLNAIKTIDCRVVNFLRLCPSVNYGRQLKEYGISERQFERKFLQSIGFTPSFYKRVVRFETALCRIHHGHYPSLAELSYTLGYSDQSHFNREFKQFSGLTPLSLITKDDVINESGSILVG
ncbi:helix-turn-helix transcriptional regulator [Fulvivirgaceae bacterium PWU5]|uniref:Helix-turn-helix transcriptional regulator n=2 Tax=Dawidia cretensis TaxID=2782350 RepID=A0AAP2GS74_9BACT|nr:helix-turn-helix transcriptional regulator [Dawidia cretensis]